MKPLILTLLCFFTIYHFANSQTDSLNIPTDTTTPADSIAVKDSIPIYNPLHQHTSQFLINSTQHHEITKHDICFLDYNGLNDIFSHFLPVFPLKLSSFGQNESFAMNGFHANDISVSFAGRPMNDPEYSSYNLNQFSQEFMEKAQVFTGSDAVILSGSPTYINLQEIRYNTATPFTRLFYTQAGFDYINADALFSQNFAPNTNFTFGFRHQTANSEFPNSFCENWNIRTMLRWNPSDLTSISLSENFTNQGNGTNGGSYNDNNKYDNILANTYYPQLTEKMFRHDLTLACSSILDKDSSSAVYASLFLTNAEWNFNISEDAKDSDDKSYIIDRSSLFTGANARYEFQPNDYLSLSAGGNLLYKDIEQSKINDALNSLDISAFVHSILHLSNATDLSAGLRFQYDKLFATIATGAKLTHALTANYSLALDASYFETAPSLVQNSFSSLEKEKNMLLTASLRYTSKLTQLQINAYARLSQSPITFQIDEQKKYPWGNYSNSDKLNAFGLNIIYNAYYNYSALFFDALGLRIKAQCNITGPESNQEYILPLFHGSAAAFCEIRRSKSILRLGLEAAATSQYSGMQYIPMLRTFNKFDSKISFMPSGFNIFATARLGNAYVRLTYENILSLNYYYVPVYPMHTGNLRLSVSWSFFD